MQPRFSGSHKPLYSGGEIAPATYKNGIGFCPLTGVSSIGEDGTSVVKPGVLVMLDITPEGRKEVVDVAIAPGKS